MNKKNRNYSREYAIYGGRPEQIKKRAKRNAARRKMEKAGRVRKGDNRDIDHKNRNVLDSDKSNLRVQSVHDNRSYSRKNERGHGKRYGTKRKGKK